MACTAKLVKIFFGARD